MLPFPPTGDPPDPCMRACKVVSVVSDSATIWTVAHQAPLSMGFSWQEYWSGLPCPSPRYLPCLEMELVSLMSPALTGRFFITSATWEAQQQVESTSKCREFQYFLKKKNQLSHWIKNCHHKLDIISRKVFDFKKTIKMITNFMIK